MGKALGIIIALAMFLGGLYAAVYAMGYISLLGFADWRGWAALIVSLTVFALGSVGVCAWVTAREGKHSR